MDQDYERRLLRQIVIQNENTMPCVSASPACPGRGELVGRRGVGVVAPGLQPLANRCAGQVTSSRRAPPGPPSGLATATLQL